MCYFDALTLNVVVFAIAGVILGYTTRNLYKHKIAKKKTNEAPSPSHQS
jgi:hypothetical protein